MSIVENHMNVMDFEMKEKMYHLYEELLFPSPSDYWSNAKWTTSMGVTYITMWDNDHLLGNINFAMIMEILGFGSYRYCIITNELPRSKQR